MRKLYKFMAVIVSAIMLFSMTVIAAADDTAGNTGADMTGEVVILHSNDVHGAVEGYATMAALKNYYKSRGAEVLLVDAGDYIQGSTYVNASQGEAVVELMNMAGYDYAAIGNHEFDYGYDNLKAIMEKAEFGVLSANTFYKDKLAFGDRAVAELGDVKVGIFGLETPETATKTHPANIKDMTFADGKDMYDIAKAQVKALDAEGCDYIICLSHLGVDDETKATANRSIDLLAEVDGIDVLIDGHSHATIDEIVEKIGGNKNKVSDTYITSTGTKFANYGVVTITADGSITTELISAEDAKAMVTEDAAVKKQADAIIAEVDKVYGEVFAKSEVFLNGERDPGTRTEETNLGDLITDAVLWSVTKDGGLKVDNANVVALNNGGGIRSSVDPGDITMKDVNAVLPFGNTVAIVYVPGEALLEVLEASTYSAPEASGSFPQVSGIEFTIDTTKEYKQGDLYPDSTYYKPAGINRVTITSVNGQPFDPSATYAVATNDFCAGGGDTYYALKAAPDVMDTGIPLDEILVQYIREGLNGVITAEDYAAPKGRITVITDQTGSGNGVTDNPATGDASVTVVWLAPAIISVIGLVSVNCKKRRD